VQSEEAGKERRRGGGGVEVVRITWPSEERGQGGQTGFVISETLVWPLSIIREQYLTLEPLKYL